MHSLFVNLSIRKERARLISSLVAADVTASIWGSSVLSLGMYGIWISLYENGINALLAIELLFFMYVSMCVCVYRNYLIGSIQTNGEMKDTALTLAMKDTAY